MHRRMDDERKVPTHTTTKKLDIFVGQLLEFLNESLRHHLTANEVTVSDAIGFGLTA
jgi:hypothetical protein